MSTTSLYPLLEAARDVLAAVPGVATSRIGLEPNMTPDAYPMVRIVPRRGEDGRMLTHRRVSCLVYFGRPIHTFTGGREEQYREHLDMEAALIDALYTSQSVRFTYRRTVFDEERVEGYRMLAIECEFDG